MAREVSLGILVRDRLHPELSLVLPLVEDTPLAVLGRPDARWPAQAAHTLCLGIAGPSNGSPVARIRLLNHNGLRVFLEGNRFDTAPYVVEPPHGAKKIVAGHALMPGQHVGLGQRYELWPTPFLLEHQEAQDVLPAMLSTMDARWVHDAALAQVVARGDGTVAWTGTSLAPPPQEPAQDAAPQPAPEPPLPLSCHLDLVFSPSPAAVPQYHRPPAVGAWLHVDAAEPVSIERSELRLRHRNHPHPEMGPPFYHAATPTPVLAVDGMPLQLARGLHRVAVNMPHVAWPHAGKITVTVTLHLTGGRVLQVVIEDGGFLPEKAGFGMS